MVKPETCYYTLIPKLERAGDESDLLGIKYQRVATGFSFVLSDKECVRIVSVHRGFLTNGLSIPLAARTLVAKWLGLDHPCVILHDWLCEYLLIESNFVGVPITRYEVQEMFINALRLTNLTSRQIATIGFLCELELLFKNPSKATLKPYKRYIEDKHYGTCN